MSNFIGSIGSFDYKLQEWKIFLSRLQQFISLNNIDVDSWKAVLLTHLNDESYRLARNLVYPNDLEGVSFEALVEIFNEHFSPKKSTFADRATFYEARKDISESIEEWVARLRGLAADCEFGTELETLLRDKFVLGMNPGPERDRLFEMDAATATLAKAQEIAKQTASARRSRSMMLKEEPVFYTGAGSSGGKRERFRGEGKRADSRRVDDAYRCSVCGLKNHSADKCRYKNYKCQKCGSKGHLKKVCEKVNVHNMCVCTPEPSNVDSGTDCKECELFNLRYVNYSPITIDVNIDNKNICMELDSGSGTSIMSESLYLKYFSNFILNACNLKMCLYNGHQISPLGYFEASLSFNGISKVLLFYVIKNGGPPLLGRDFMAKFNVGLVTNNNKIFTNQMPSEVSWILNEFPKLFQDDLGRFNKYEIELQLKKGTIPKYFKPRPVPFALKERVEEEITRLENLGILVPVTFSKYASPIVPVLKENGKVKIAGDFSVTINNDLIIDKYPMPRIEEVFEKLKGGEFYSKLDLCNAYNQFSLSESSQQLTTINTSKGLYKFTRLLYGLAPAPALFQRAIESLLVGIKGVSVWLDDVCLTGPDKSTHLARLREVLRRFDEAGLRLQKDKCSFFQSSVTYLGYVIDKKGLKTCPKKVEAIGKTQIPTNVLELKRFLGMINYYRNFIPQASDRLGPLNKLLRDGVEWEWGRQQQCAFDYAKAELSSERVLAHFDPSARLVLAVDAGPAGLGAVLSQLSSQGEERPLAFASRSLSSSERNYSQIQKEATAIIFGVKKFHQYLYGRKDPFILKTDHRPLLSIFGKKVGISVMAASRLQRYAIILSAYNYEVQYIRSTNNLVADYFSRAPLPAVPGEQVQNNNIFYSDYEVEDESLFIKFLDANIAPVTFTELERLTLRDPILQTVAKYMKHGWPRKIICPSIKPYFNCKFDLETQGNCLFRGHRIVIPSNCQGRMLSELHVGHPGIVKSKSAARSRMWWPGIDKDIERYIGSCGACCATRAAPARAPPAPWPRPAQPWQRIHIDYMQLAQRDYLIVIDAYSKWLECMLMDRGTSTHALINKLKLLFSRFGIPHVIMSDNDTKINSLEFKTFCTVNGIKHMTSPIYHPSSNGQAENSVKSCKNFIKCIYKENQSPTDEFINNKLLGFLFQYRNTIHCATGVSPAKLMLGRDLMSRLDLVLPPQQGSIRKCDHQLKRFEVGDSVWFHYFVNRRKRWELGQIKEKIGSRMFVISTPDNTETYKRHYDQIRRYTGEAIARKEYENVSASDQLTLEVQSPPPPTSAAAAFVTQDEALPASSLGQPDVEVCEENLDSGQINTEEDEWAEAESDQDHSGEGSSVISNKDKNVKPLPWTLRSRNDVNYKPFF